MSSFVPTSGVVRLTRWSDERHRGQVRLLSDALADTDEHARVGAEQKVRAESEERIAFHEALHYWQHISHRFLLRVIEEDWRRLERFEADQTVLPPGPLKQELLRVDAELGFSARDLLECLTRYWELVAFKVDDLLAMDMALRGPALARRLAIDAAMDGRPLRGRLVAMKAAAGRYGLPYLKAAEQFPDEFTLAVAFPFVARIALQSSHPTLAFKRAVKSAGSVATALRSSPNSEREKAAFAREVRIAVDEELPEIRDVYIEQVEEVFSSSALVTHPGYQYAFEALRTSRVHMMRVGAALAPLRETLRRDFNAILARFDSTAQKVVRAVSAEAGETPGASVRRSDECVPGRGCRDDTLIGAYQWELIGDGGSAEHVFMFMGEDINRKILARVLPPPTLVEDDVSVGYGVVPPTKHPMGILLGPAPDVAPDPRSFVHRPGAPLAQTYAKDVNPALESLFEIARQCADIDVRWRNFRTYARGY